MRYDVVFSEITGRGYRYPKCPGTDYGSSAFSVIYETKKSRQKMSHTALCGAIRMMRKQESAEAIVAQRWG